MEWLRWIGIGRFVEFLNTSSTEKKKNLVLEKIHNWKRILVDSDLMMHNAYRKVMVKNRRGLFGAREMQGKSDLKKGKKK